MIPTGVLVTVPSPVPALLTARVKVWRSKVAVTVVAALRVTVHAPVPVQPPPLQPVNVESAAGVAVTATTGPPDWGAEHVAPQLPPAGPRATVPGPAPAGVAVSAKVGVKGAVTAVAAETVTVQAAVPVQPPPLQPVKAELAPGVAVSVTTVPLA